MHKGMHVCGADTSEAKYLRRYVLEMSQKYSNRADYSHLKELM